MVFLLIVMLSISCIFQICLFLNKFGELVIEGVDIFYLGIFMVLKILHLSFPTRQDATYF